MMLESSLQSVGEMKMNLYFLVGGSQNVLGVFKKRTVYLVQ